MAIPQSVLRAKLTGDTETLRYLGKLGGKIGAQRRRNKKEILEDLELRNRIFGARLSSREAHEDICPVDD